MAGLLVSRLGFLLRSDGLDANEAARTPTVNKLHAAVNLCKERIVTAATDIQSRLERCSTLPHDNRSAGNQLAAESLYAQALCV